MQLTVVFSVPSPASLGPVDLDVADDQLVGFHLLRVGVRLHVLQDVHDDLHRLLRPSSLGDAELDGRACPGDVAVESGNGNAPLVLEDVVEVSDGVLDALALEHLRGLPSVLEVHSEVLASGLH